MNGLSKGEQSSATNPVLQLFCRNGEFLADPVAATYLIEEVRDPSAPPVTRVALASFNLAAVPTGHKLGTGRLYIPTGSTSTWSYGTHRAICTYQMVAGGRTYTQEIYFEVLNPALFASGQEYVGYVSTRDLYLDQVAVLSVTAPDLLHRAIRMVSIQLEGYTKRFFEPRYLQYRVNGANKTRLFMDEAIVAIEKVEALARNSDGAEDVTLYETSAYRVMNRHLDGVLDPDDRDNPYIALIETRNVLGETMLYGDFTWPYGVQNLLVTGVFGYTDPSVRPDRVAIGHTPDDLRRVATALVARSFADVTLTSLTVSSPGSLKSYRTRDQSISFYGGSSSSSSSSGGITGDSIIDQLLIRFCKAARLSYPERDVAYIPRGALE